MTKIELLRSALGRVSTPRLKILSRSKFYPAGQIVGKKDKKVIREILKSRK